jgi:hypothetical protein
MAENVPITPGSGENIAADEYQINGVTVKVQRMKLQVGGDNSGTDLTGDASFGADVDVTRLPTIQSKGFGTTLAADQSTSWANSAAVNTANNVDIAMPAELQPEGRYAIAILNPSTVTDLSVIIKAQETSFNAATRYVELTSFTMPKNKADGKYFIVTGLVGSSLRLTLSNDTVLGGADGFTAYIRVKKI